MLDTLIQMWKILQSLHGAGGLTVVAGIVQLAMLYFNSKFADSITAKVKLAIVSGLTLAGAIVAGLLAGTPITAVLMSGIVLSALQVFVHQLMKVYFPDDSDQKDNTSKK